MDDKTTKQSQPIPSKYNQKRILTGGLAALGLVLVGWIIWHTIYGSKVSDYKYGQLKSYKIPGFAANTGMSFNVPIELSAISPLAKNQYAQRFADNKLLPNAKFTTLTYESAGIGYAPRQSGDAQKAVYKQVSDAINDSTNSNHASYMNTLQRFVKTNTNDRWTMTFQAPKSLTTPNLKNYTWEMDFSGKDTIPADSYKPKKLTGEMVYSVTNGNYYYFLIASVDNNWQNNKQVWQNVINSLKVDQ